MRHSQCRGLLVLLIGAVAALSGCSYSHNRLLRDDIHTVHIPVFDNKTWRRGLEVELTRAVLDEVKLHTRLLIAAKHDADSTLEGELLEFTTEIITKTEDDVVLLKRITVKAQFRWVDNLTGRDIVPSQTVVETTIVPPLPGESVEEKPFAKLAQRIVERMEKDW